MSVRINSEVHIQYARRIKIVTCTAKGSHGNDHACLVQYAVFKETITSGKRLYIYRDTDLQEWTGSQWNIQKSLHQEDYEAKQETLQPVYPLTSGLTNKLDIQSNVSDKRLYLSDSRISSAKYS